MQRKAEEEGRRGGEGEEGRRGGGGGEAVPPNHQQKLLTLGWFSQSAIVLQAHPLLVLTGNSLTSMRQFPEDKFDCSCKRFPYKTVAQKLLIHGRTRSITLQQGSLPGTSSLLAESSLLRSSVTYSDYLHHR